MNSDSPLGAIPALISRVLAVRRAKAAQQTKPAKPVRMLEELLLVALLASLIAMIGFGVEHPIASQALATSLVARLLLQTVRISGLVRKGIVGSAPTVAAYIISVITTAIIVVGAFINSDAYLLMGAVSVVFVARLLRKLLPMVHQVAQERYVGHVARMEAEQAARKR